MRGVVEAGGEKPPAIRLGLTCLRFYLGRLYVQLDPESSGYF